MSKAIFKSISENIEDADNYLKLADYYVDINLNQAYLSLENAMFYENDPDKVKNIRMMIDEIKKSGKISVAQSSFVILSFRNLEYTKKCIESIRITCCPGSYEIIVVDNASGPEVVAWLQEQSDIKLILNEENLGFPAGCNQGIRAASEGNDIFLLNNDTVMLPNSLYCLRMALYSDTSVGAVGAMGSHVPNGQKEPGMDTLEQCIDHALRNNIPDPSGYEKKVWLVGFAFLIRNDVWKKVGYLDERFSPGNYEDNDYSLRIIENGYKNILCHNCLIVHYGGKGFSTTTNNQSYMDLCKLNNGKLNEKWGFNVSYYGNPRKDLIDFIEKDHPDHNDEFSVLECGCGMGSTLIRIQYLYPNVSVHGIELMERPASLGANICDIELGNIEEIEWNEMEKSFDYIIFGDVIEHLVDPYGIMRNCRAVLKKNGKVIASIPNIMHYSVIIPLLKGYFPFERAGIRDYTHLHNWTMSNIYEMFDECGYSIEEVKCSVLQKAVTDKFIEEDDWIWFQRLIDRSETAEEWQFNAYQYLVQAKKLD
ncbi:Glycosyltransferase, GT2 family [Lachnospiraceae bacterium]|nr:Glycosyltransferase, GT2 family [Lachnospiraceae bacterium]